MILQKAVDNFLAKETTKDKGDKVTESTGISDTEVLKIADNNNFDLIP